MTTPAFNTGVLTPKYVFHENTTTGTEVVYAPATNRAFKIQGLTVSNRSASPVVIDAYLVPNGASVNARHKVIVELTIPAKDTLSLEPYFEGFMIGELDGIVSQASVADVVSFFLSGVEVV